MPVKPSTAMRRRVNESVCWGVAGSAQTASEKLGRLNAVATVVEYEVEEDGSYSWKLWEWTGAAG